MLNKLILSTIFCVVFLSNYSYASDVVVNFTGNITQSPCTVNGGEGSMDVSLGEVQSSIFDSGVGATGPSTPIPIDLNCPAGLTTAVFSFNSASVQDAQIGLLDNTATTGASGVGVQILQNESSTPVVVDGSTAVSKSIVEGLQTLNFYARIYRYGTTFGVGSNGAINSSMSITIVYQ